MYTDVHGRVYELEVDELDDTRDWDAEDDELHYLDRADAQEAYEEFQKEWN